MDHLIGRSLGQYRLIAVLGAGAMGTVFHAEQVALLQPRAVKVLRPELAADPRFVERFLREARLAAALRHPNIVQIYDADRSGGFHYIAMELVAGHTLSELRREGGRLSFGRTVDLLRQVAAALDYAHGGDPERGKRTVIHRDVKSGNIMVGPDGHVTLLDFGLARAAQGTAFTMPGGPSGTPAFMAPEVIAGAEATPSADLYSLGVVAYELLTGYVPFRAPTATAIMYAHVHLPPPSPRSLQPLLPEAAEEVLLRQLAKDPSERFPDATSFVGALTNALASAEPLSRDPPHPTRSPTVALAPVEPDWRDDPTEELEIPASLSDPPSTATSAQSRQLARRIPEPSPRRRRTRLFYAALAALLLVGVADIILLWPVISTGMPPSAPPPSDETASATPSPEVATATAGLAAARETPTVEASPTARASTPVAAIQTATATPTNTPTATASPTRTLPPTPTLAPGRLGLRILDPADGASVPERVLVRGSEIIPPPAGAHVWLFVRAEVPGAHWYPCPHELEVSPDLTWECEIYFGGSAGIRHTLLVGVADDPTNAFLTGYIASNPNQPLYPERPEATLPPGFVEEARVVVVRQ